MQRFYLPNIKFLENINISDSEIVHQLTRVLRSKIADEVVFFDGENLEDHIYEIVGISKKDITLAKKESVSKESELDFELVLFQALPNKLSKLEYIVQKCSEVGFSKLVFFSSERSQRLVLSENKKERLGKIMQEAIEQCGRNKIYTLEFRDQIPLPYEWINIVFHQELNGDSIPIKDVSIQKGQTVNIYVWPEWGFSEDEILQFSEQKFQKVYLWERVLRCETAGVVTGFFLSQNR